MVARQALRALVLFQAAGVVIGAELPIIDLGTSVHRAQVNATGGYYSFKNIPYAEPPVGDLRFRLPVPLATVNRTVNDGSNPRVCYQGSGPWFQYSIPLVTQTIMDGGITIPPAGPSQPGPGPSEDCLLLDVSVPKDVFDAQAATALTKPIPVLVWIHGGGYIEGSKQGYNPAGLIAQSRRNGAKGVIFVAIQYRLGLFGFPPRQPSMLDVASNAGLYDQRLALEWVRLNIRRFGGDPSSVTVMGESAGAGSIASQLLAFGGIDGLSPFNKAILQSPYIEPVVGPALYSTFYQQFLTTSNTTSYEAARQLSSAQLAAVNTAMIKTATFATSVFGPNVDGVFIPDYPAAMLAEGRVDKNVEVIVAHNSNEGLLFADPRVSDQAGFTTFLAGLAPSAPAAKINTLAKQIYPPDFSGAYPYRNQVERTTLAVGEGLLSCIAFGLNLAYKNQSRSYQFSTFPGIHGEDVQYTFFNGESLGSFGIPINASVATTMQAWFVDFAMLGAGSGSTVTQLPVYTSKANVANITGSGFPIVRDQAANQRCRYWLTELTP